MILPIQPRCRSGFTFSNNCDPAVRLSYHDYLTTCESLIIKNPKRGSATQLGRDQWFPYYAGFSGDFASQLIASSGLTKGSLLMDPWNGSGTTTSLAVLHGYRAIGFDLNPVMVVVAKARLLPHSEFASIKPLLADILRKSARAKNAPDREDSLQIWFAPDAALAARRIEHAINNLLVSPLRTGSVLDSAQDISSIAAFFYVALFRAIRVLLHRFRASNPTWIKRPRTGNQRLRPAASQIRECFASCVTQMMGSALSTPAEWKHRTARPTIEVASSEDLPIRRETIDFVLSSPPYCTRIDYGIATLPELAVLGFELDKHLDELRARLIGTPTINSETPHQCTSWGNTCATLLERIGNHRSKAAESYYYKTYAQYFAAISQSFSELARCLKPRGQCVLVVQDSYFKDVHVDLASIFVEMGLAASLELRRRVDFPIARTFGSVNQGSRSYRAVSSATESVLCFVKCD
jgi:SAM-dependent methyltransferase